MTEPPPTPHDRRQVTSDEGDRTTNVLNGDAVNLLSIDATTRAPRPPSSTSAR